MPYAHRTVELATGGSADRTDGGPTPVAGAPLRAEFSSGVNSVWRDGEAVPWEAWAEVQRRGVAAGLSGRVMTAELAERLYPKAEWERRDG